MHDAAEGGAGDSAEAEGETEVHLYVAQPVMLKILLQRPERSESAVADDTERQARLVRATARAYDAKAPGVSDPDVSMQASCTKLFTTEMVGRVADRGVQIHGGAGYMNEYKVERFYRDVRLLRLYEGTSQIQQLVIAKHLMRAP